MSSASQVKLARSLAKRIDFILLYLWPEVDSLVNLESESSIETSLQPLIKNISLSLSLSLTVCPKRQSGNVGPQEGTPYGFSC